MNNDFDVETLSDEELLRRTGELAARERRIEAALIAHMAGVDHRKLYRGQACSSMFAYATGRLRLSESQAYDRITVARTSRKFPLVLEMLADGRLTLTGASKLGPHLTAENATTLLARAVHASRRQGWSRREVPGRAGSRRVGRPQCMYRFARLQRDDSRATGDAGRCGPSARERVRL